MGLAAQILRLTEERLGYTLIRFQDGLEWVRISENPDRIVLRSKESAGRKKGELWSPRIEALVVNGALKKFKGRIKKAYHKYLLALLLHSSISGVALAENSDFKMSMFDDATLQELDKVKPELLGPEFRRRLDTRSYR